MIHGSRYGVCDKVLSLLIYLAIDKTFSEFILQVWIISYSGVNKSLLKEQLYLVVCGQFL